MNFYFENNKILIETFNQFKNRILSLKNDKFFKGHESANLTI
jgi:hypothetical protein